jgi:hypothetical protein
LRQLLDTPQSDDSLSMSREIHRPIARLPANQHAPATTLQWRLLGSGPSITRNPGSPPSKIACIRYRGMLLLVRHTPWTLSDFPTLLLPLLLSHIYPLIYTHGKLDWINRTAIHIYKKLSIPPRQGLPLVRLGWSVDTRKDAWNPTYEGYSGWEQCTESNCTSV